MFRFKYIFVMVLFSLMLINLCWGAKRFKIIRSPKEHVLVQYQTLEIQNFKTTVQGEVDKDILVAIPDAILKTLTEKSFFRKVTLAPTNDPKVLLMNCNIISYNDPTTSREIFTPGSVVCSVQCEFIDKASQKSLSTVVFSGKGAGGAFNVSRSKGIPKSIAKAVLDFFEEFH